MAGFTASEAKRWLSQWRKKGHRRASGAIKLLPVIVWLWAKERLHGCAEARMILSDMRFEQPTSRIIAMTYDQSPAIVKKSGQMKCPSIGVVEALKFKTAL